MPLHRFKRPRAEHPFVGLWHITSMEVWDNDYVNMERQAFASRPEAAHVWSSVSTYSSPLTWQPGADGNAEFSSHEFGYLSR